MPRLGGMSPFPLRFGGGEGRVQTILTSFNADRGTAFDTADRETVVYAINMAIARAIAAAWGSNERLSRIWIPASMPVDVLARWEKILNISPLPTDAPKDRRDRVAEVMARFGQATLEARIDALLTEKLGDAYVQIEHIAYSNALIYVPDGSYPWGVVGSVPWSSTVAHLLVQLQKPTGWTEGEFYDAAGKVPQLLEPLLPVWVTVDWYRPGPISVDVGGPEAGGFYLDDDHNLDNEVFDV